MSKNPPDFFSGEAALAYDEKNMKLSRISDCLHFLVGLILKNLPRHARILCVGVGTGAEIFVSSKIVSRVEVCGIGSLASDA